MDKLAKKLAERAALSQQLASFSQKLIELDAEIFTLYNEQNPKTPDSEFIIQARADCEKLLKALRGHPYKLLKALLESPLGIVDYDTTVDTVWPNGISSSTSVHDVAKYLEPILLSKASE